MPAVQLTIDDRLVEASASESVLEAAQRAQITIPTLCHHPDLTPTGSCRLCLVEVEGSSSQVAACTLAVQPGMRVRTASPALTRSRQAVLGFLLARFHDAGYTADGRETEFSHWVRELEAQPFAGAAGVPHTAVDSDPNPFIWVDLNKCILCTRCVRACREVQGRFVWGVEARGQESTIIAGIGTTLLDARCESCGACVAYCPTGALDDKPSVRNGADDTVVSTICGYCGVGCTLDLHVRQNTVVQVTSREDAPVNGLSLCVKGRYGYEYVHHADRLQRPRVRKYLLEQRVRPAGGRDEWVETDWDTALDLAARRLAAIVEESGADSIGVLSSAKCTNEENYLMQKFARQVLGTHNVDHCARLCHSSTVTGLASCFGSGAMSNTMRDVAEQSQAIFLIGSNVTEQHPVFGTMLRQAVMRRGVPLVVADPRRIDITEFATLHLQQRPGTDVALLNGIMHLVLANGWEDREFIARRCEEFDSFREKIAEYAPDRVAEITGVPVADLERAAEIMGRNRPLAVIWAMGITQHTTGVLNVLSLGNLQMLLGNMGVPGGGVNPLRGQNNVQGACDMGSLPNVFPGYQSVTSDDVRKKFSEGWRLAGGDEAAGLPPGLGKPPGLTVTEMVTGAGTGNLRALYILGENPAVTDPDVNHVHRALEACELLILQEIFPSETSRFADILLPGVSWAEKDGTFTNTERRVQLVRRAIEPLGEARQDWAIVSDLARRILQQQRRVPAARWSSWSYSHPGQIMEEIAALTPIYGGVTWERLERGETLHWPVLDGRHPGTPILHVGQFTRGKGKFHPVDHLPPHELPDAEYPLVLTTGRVLYHWHGGEMTRRVDGLNAVCPESVVEIHPEDALRIGVAETDWIRVESRRGAIVARAEVTDRVPAGLLFANFHFPAANANALTINAVDPVAKIPEYKVCAVRASSVRVSSVRGSAGSLTP